MPNPFTYLAYDLTTGQEIDALPYQAVTFGRQLNQPGPWNGSLPLADPRVQNTDWPSATLPSRTALFVDYRGALIWGGIIWTSNYQKADPTKTLKVGAMEFGSYLRQRVQAADYSNTWPTGADPMLVAQRVIQDALTAGSILGGLTLTLNPVGGEGGPLVSPSYPATAIQTIDSIVSILSQMGYGFGFDYSFDVAYLPGTKTPGVTMNIWYPRQGRVYTNSQIVLLGKDTLDYTYPVDGTQQGTKIIETGSGSLTPATAQVTIPGYPLLEKPVARTQVQDENTLVNIALGDLGLYAWPVVSPTVTIPVPATQAGIDQGRLTFGGFDLGDDLLLRIDPIAGGGENTDPRFPAGMQFEWRISQWTCTVKDTGVSSILFDLAIPPSQSTVPPQPPL